MLSINWSCSKLHSFFHMLTHAFTRIQQLNMTSYFLSGFSQNQSPVSGTKLVAVGLPSGEVSAEISSPSLISSPSSSYISNEMSTSSYVSSEMLEYIFGHVIVALAFGGLVVNTCALVSFN